MRTYYIQALVPAVSSMPTILARSQGTMDTQIGYGRELYAQNKDWQHRGVADGFNVYKVNLNQIGSLMTVRNITVLNNGSVYSEKDITQWCRQHPNQYAELKKKIESIQHRIRRSNKPTH